jgi:hypothetical protein
MTDLEMQTAFVDILDLLSRTHFQSSAASALALATYESLAADSDRFAEDIRKRLGDKLPLQTLLDQMAETRALIAKLKESFPRNDRPTFQREVKA